MHDSSISIDEGELRLLFAFIQAILGRPDLEFQRTGSAQAKVNLICVGIHGDTIERVRRCLRRSPNLRTLERHLEEDRMWNELIESGRGVWAVVRQKIEASEREEGLIHGE